MTQRSLLITGCSSGIGYDAAHGMAKRGWRVFATDSMVRASFLLLLSFVAVGLIIKN